MNKNIHLQIDINALRDFIKENPSFVFNGKKEYISLTLFANTTPDQYGNDYAIKPRASKILIEKYGKKIPYFGNAKIAEPYSGGGAPQTPIRNATPKVDLDSDVPF